MKQSLLTLCILAAFAGQATGREAAPEPVALQLKWFHQFQFAGYYAAVEQGYYREAGLDVEIREGAPRTDSVEEVVSGRAEYGVSNSEALLRRLRGEPVVALAAIFQHSPLVFITVEDSDIRHPQDMVGHRVGVSKSTRDAELLAMLHNEGVSLDDIQPPKGGQFNVAMYYDGSADVGSAYITNEPFYLEEKGIPYRVLHPLTYGIDFYGDGLITSERELTDHPDRVKRFREASLRGWEYAMAHPESMVDLIIERYGSRKSRAHLLYEAEKMKELILPKLIEMGHMNPGRWRHIADIFVALKMAPADYSLEGFIYDPDPPPNLKRIRRYLLTLTLIIAAAGFGLFILFYFNRRLRKEVQEREAAEKTLRFQADLLNQIQDAIVATDIKGRIRYVNDAVVKATGKPADRLIGETVHILSDPGAADMQQAIMDRTISDGEWRGRVVNDTEDGSPIVFETRTWVVRDPDGNPAGMVGVSTDITERERLAEDLRAARDAADAANRAKSEFLANMSHEIRTPMNAVLGFSEILLDRTEDTQTRNYLKNIHSSGGALLDLIDDILDLSKIEAGKMDILPAPVVIRDLLDDIRSMFSRQTTKKGLHFEVAVPADFPEALMLDDARLRQVLVNLVSNAVKFTRQGHIRIRAHSRRRAADSAPGNPDRLDIAFGIEDSGSGIPEDQLERVFEPFRQQTAQKPAEYTGTGLGLSITKSLVSLMNGDISVESRIGVGSTFHILLRDVPVADPAAIPDPACAVQEAVFVFEPAVVLLVDDIPSNRILIQGYLEGRNLTVVEAESGERALQLLGIGDFRDLDAPPMDRPDAVLMDIRMPGMDGYETTRRIKETPSFEDVPIIAFTASAMKEEVERALSIFDGYIRKPASKVQILEALKNHLSCKPGGTEAPDAEAPSDAILPADIRDRSPEIADRVEAELLPEWREVMDLFFIDDVADFARKVDRFALRYEIAPLSDYARKLLESATHLEVEAMNRLMADFEKIVGEMVG